MANYCYQCGSPLEEGATECSCCGAPVRSHRRSAEASARQRRGKRNRLPGRALLFGAGGLLAVVLLCLLIFGGGHSIRLDKYVDVSFNGYDGYGTATVTFDRERFNKDNRRLKFKGDSGIYLYMDPVETLLLTCVDGKLDTNSQLSNGDKVVYHWSCDEAQARALFGVKLRYSDLRFEVRGLEKVKTFDAFADLDLQVSGANGFGRLSLNNTAPQDSPAYKLNFSADRSRGLSNGDVVTVSLSAGWMSQEQMVQSLLKEYGAVPDRLENSYTIGDLREPETFDPFDYIELNLKGVSGEGELSAVILRDEPAMKSASVSFDKNRQLSNGDTVTVRVSFGYYRDTADMEEALEEACGMIPSRFEKSFMIEGMNRYVQTTEDLSEAASQAMGQQLEDVVSSYAATWWRSTEHLDGMEYVGTYVLLKKDSGIYGMNNYVDIVYQINTTVSIPEKGINQSFPYYYVLSYRNVVVDSDGNFISGKYDRVDYFCQYQPNIPGYSYYYTGFGSLQDVYQYYVTRKLENYTFTVSGNLPTA